MTTYLLLLLRPDDLEGAEALAGAAAATAAASLFLTEAVPSLVAAATAAEVASFSFALSAAEEDDCLFLPLFPFS